MDQCERFLELLLETIKKEPPTDSQSIPVGISNRHVHLSQQDLEALFGPDHVLEKMKDLSQPGQYACKETVTICGPKGAIEKVRILGPARKQTQIELLAGDCFKLGIKAPVRLSGDLNTTPGLTLVGPCGSVQTSQGAIVAQRHIHMAPQDAVHFGVHDGQVVALQLDGLRGGTLQNAVVRVTEQSALECHLDTEEANAMGIGAGAVVRIV